MLVIALAESVPQATEQDQSENNYAHRDKNCQPNSPLSGVRTHFRIQKRLGRDEGVI